LITNEAGYVDGCNRKCSLCIQ